MREGEPIEECDDNESCEIIADSFFGEVVEWRELENGNILCVAYVEVVTESVRDDRTIDMFEEAE